MTVSEPSQVIQPSIPDCGQSNEQSAPQLSLRTSPELLAALERAKAHVMTPAERYEQRRSFTRGMCPSNRDYAEWCAEVDKLLPPLPAVAETRRDVPENVGLVSGASSDPFSSTRKDERA